MKKHVFLAMSLVACATAIAQNSVEATVKADFVNEYIWRGLDCGSVAVQPTLGIAYKGLSLSALGSYGLTDTADVKEMDITASYRTRGFTVGATDYWFSEGLDPNARYFKYDAHGTNHVFEAFVSYDFGVLSTSWYTNIGGNDGFNKDGKRAYSSYFEATLPFQLAGMTWTATAGAVPWASTFYGTNGFAVTNLSLKAEKEIRITESFSIPVFGQLIGNPCAQKAYLVFGFTLHS